MCVLKYLSRGSILAASLLATALSAHAEIRLPHVLSDHAVLQRDEPIRIWGWADKEEKVTVSFRGQSIHAEPDLHGVWSAWLRPEQAGGPYKLTVTGTKTAQPIVRTDILIGDVWIASGQSNMAMPLKGFAADMPIKDSEKEIAAANQPQIHLLREETHASSIVAGDIPEQWTLCTPDTARDFSALAYFFGREIAKAEHVPVGIIEAAVGGTPVQSWISLAGSTYSSLPTVMSYAARVALRGGSVDAAPEPDRSHTLHADYTPSTLYNGMIAPLTMYTVKGVIWYQGEADASDVLAPTYQQRFEALIRDWRIQWQQSNLPFLYVQISSVGNRNYWGAVRNAQREALELRDTAMAVSLDVGRTDNNAHPADKQTVASRLSKAALGMVYGEKVEYVSPLFDSATTEGDSIRAWFSHADNLHSSDGSVNGFEIAGEDHKFIPATAKIEQVGQRMTIVARAPGISAPKYIRYGWKSFIDSYLYNSNSLPMSTFTSETEPWITLR